MTDASVVLGYIDPDYFAGGSLKLSTELARRTHRDDDRPSARPHASSMPRSASIASLNAQMAEAIRLVSIGRGIDPRGYTLLPLGGGGPLHATALARELGIGRSSCRRIPACCRPPACCRRRSSTRVSAAFPRPLAGLDWPRWNARSPLRRGLRRLMRSEGVARRGRRTSATSPMSATSARATISRSASDRGAPTRSSALYRDFLAAHDRIYGHGTEGPARSSICARCTGSRPGFDGAAAPSYSGESGNPDNSPGADRPGDRVRDAAVYRREGLAMGRRIDGPAIVEQPDTTVLLPGGWHGAVSAGGVLVLEPRHRQRG